MPKTVLIQGQDQPLPVSEVPIDAIMLIKPGQMIPLDGTIEKGLSFVDESPITGEPLPKDKRPGDLVFAGSLNKQGALEVKVTKIYVDSTIEKIREMTFKAFKNKAQTQKFIETFSQYYTPAIMLLAIFWTLFNWLYFQRPFNQGFADALALLVIACPCALVISTPISIFAAIGNASSSGILVKGGRYLEALAQIKALGIDKTRTLTVGKPVVTEVIPFGDHTKEILLSCAAGLEKLSEHPLGQSIVDEAQKQNLAFHDVENFQAVIGKGAKADCLICEDKHHCIGKLQFILEEHPVPEKFIDQIETFQKQGKTVIAVSTNKEVEGILVFEDQIRPDSLQFVSDLKKLGIEPIMLTGDHLNVAQSVAQKLGIEQVRADLLPQDKAKKIQAISEEYGKVGMFGDGVNDAPALALSSVGISMNTLGSDTAIEAASIVLLNDQLKLIPQMIKLSRQTLKTIHFNVGLAIIVKVIFITLALLSLSNLALAILADVGVTLLVILNSLRLMHHSMD